MDQIQIDALQPDDSHTFKALRLEALRTEPAAFSSTYEDALARSDDDWRALLAEPRRAFLMAWTDDSPIGMVGLYRGGDDGNERVAIVTSMYVSGDYRRRGVGKRLLALLIVLALENPDIATLRLWVSEAQVTARRLYETIGFNVVGRDKRQVQGDSHQYDELIMERPVRQD
jgi:ribosomal protein S18 acetylase RimI-like enzyme